MIVAPEGLISWWKFDGDFTDSAGSNDGIAYGDAYIDNNELVLDGYGDYVDAGNGASLDITNLITLSVWVKPFDLAKDWQRVVSKTDDTDYTAFILGISSAGGIYFSLYKEGSTTQYYVDGQTSLNSNQWNHIVGLWNGTNEVIYLNGVRQSETLTFTGPIKITSSPVRIGRGTLTNFAFNGTIDDVIIFNRSLTEEEIQNIYNSQRK